MTLISKTFRLHAALLTPMLTLLVGCATAFHTTGSGSSPIHLKIMQQPQDKTVMAEQNASFIVSATSDTTLHYQWYSQGKLVPGATSATYTVSNAHLNQTGSTIAVSVTDSSTIEQSDPAVLTVEALNPNLTLPATAGMKYGAAPFQVEATSASSGAISYSIASGPATISGNQVMVTGVGKVILTATQVAYGDYDSGVASTSFDVGQNVQVSAITPSNITIAPGVVPYSAVATGGLTNKLIWTASGGSFSGSVWTSSNVAGDYTIITTSVDDPTKASITTATISIPVIIQQPVAGSVCSNAPSQLSVSANYAQNYQWQLNGAALPGATSSTYFMPSPNASLDSGSYTVAVSNPAGTVLSNAVSLSVGSKIASNPVNVAVPASQPATFFVSASGKGPFKYQWYAVAPTSSSSVLIAGATSNTYTIPSTTLAQNGSQYFAVASDSCGTAMNSTPATLTVVGTNTPPTIDQQPVSLSILPGGQATFTVHAEGSQTLTYQWYQVSTATGMTYGLPIQGATGTSYTLPANATLAANNQDAYYVTVTNPYGTAGSLHAILTVGAGISITQQPMNVSLNSGESATYNVTATSSLPLSYQWYRAAPASAAFTAIPNATSSTYSTPPVDSTQNGSTYYAVVSNGVTASVSSTMASLTVGQQVDFDGCSWVIGWTATEEANCSYELTNTWGQSAQIHWPNQIPTNHLTLSFTMTIDNTTIQPADGFAVMLADPSLGATTDMHGLYGWGLGAAGIPGVAITFDDFFNGASWFPVGPGDPGPMYIGVTRGDTDLYENPFFMANTAISPIAAYGQSISHDYVITMIGKIMTVTMDGIQILSGQVDVPPSAYLLVTAGTGGSMERTVISNLKTSFQ